MASQISPDQDSEIINRIAKSSVFHGSETMVRLLRYLAEKSHEDPGEAVKEYQIATEALGRKSDFDPRLDSYVRTQVTRLRSKLLEYTLTEGVNDPVCVEIPKGAYKLVIAPTRQARVPSAQAEDELSPSSTEIATKSSDENSPSLKSRQPQINQSAQIARGPVSGMVLLVSALVVVGLLLFAAGYWTRTVLPAAQSDAGFSRQTLSSTNDPVRAFWVPFLKEDPSPIIVYADPIFLIDKSGDLLRFRRGAADFRGSKVDPGVALQYASNPTVVKAAGSLYYDNGYTGTGDLMAVSTLIALISRMGGTPRVQPSRQITLGDLKAHNVILVGSTFQNLAVAQLVSTGDFVFVEPNAQDPWSGQIVNTRPQPGEQSKYDIALDASTHTVRGDYALISFQPGMAPGHHIALVAGIDTTGNEAAALFLSSEEGVRDISNAMSHIRNGQSPTNLAFQALLHVDIAEGSQVRDTRLVSLHSSPAIRMKGNDSSSQ